VATSSDMVVFARDELDLIVEFAGCSLDESPGSNWVQANGGLPDYICRIAKAIKKSGKTTSQAISIAVDRVKVWSTGKGVDKDTQGKAAAALAQWEALRAKSHAKTAAKDAKKVAASNSWMGEILVLSDSVTVFNVDAVRAAWTSQTNAWRRKFEQSYPSGGMDAPPTYSYIKEMWTDHLIVSADGDNGGGESLFKVDYTVDADGNVTFDQPVPVKTQYIAIDRDDMVGRQMSNSQLRQLMATVGPCNSGATDKVLLTISRERPSALTQVLAHRPRPSALSEVLAANPALPTSAVETFLKLTDRK
jgi:hypothetical protein